MAGKGVLTYGYNIILLINEDYVHAYHSTKDHYAYVKNGNGTFRVQMLVKVIGLKLRLLIRENLWLPTVIAINKGLG